MYITQKDLFQFAKLTKLRWLEGIDLRCARRARRMLRTIAKYNRSRYISCDRYYLKSIVFQKMDMFEQDEGSLYYEVWIT